MADTVNVDARLVVKDGVTERPLEPADLATARTGAATQTTLAAALVELQAILAKLAGKLTVDVATQPAVALDAATLLALETVTALGPLTNTELRAAAVPVTGTVNVDFVGEGTLATDANLTALRTERAAAEAARDLDATAAQTRLDLLATEAKLEAVRAQVAAAEAARDLDATAAQVRLDLLATEATLEALRAAITSGVKQKRLTGGGYAAGVGAATVNVPAGKVIEKVSCAASQIQDVTLTVGAGAPAVTVKAGLAFEDAFCGLGTGLAVSFAGGVDSYFVRWADA